MLINKLSFGLFGEDKAVKYLKKKGYKILERNYKKANGEIDIIALKDDFIIFIEVKTRSSSKYGKGYEAVDYKKQQKIINTANMYIIEHSIDKICRFDVISIDNGEISHIENAFSL